MNTAKESRKRILFVDDEPNILQMLDRLLHQSDVDWIPEFCLGVDEALAVLKTIPFDAVVTDIRMPEKDGFELVAAMHADNSLRRIPVIILTGEGDRTLKRRALDCGATDLLNKPVSREDLIARLRSVLRIKDYEDRLSDQVKLLDGLVKERTRDLERSHREVIWRLAKAGEYRDDQTGNHVARVAWCSCLLAAEIGMKPCDVELLLQTSPLHDIGKIGIPDSILLKPGQLTPDERAVMERHTLIGEDILRQPPRAFAPLKDHDGALLLSLAGGNRLPMIEMACAVARHHHERWDGTGYPDSLARDAIPLEARIVALADVYDALISERPYKKPIPRERALSILKEGSGHHFDPDLVQIFVANVTKIDETYVRLAGPNSYSFSKV
ncbi:MAG: response regulator [Candidatus Hydrogenedentes bacterium]|nr:response regulator [Candidatus Hydrogenedentota bacterium]